MLMNKVLVKMFFPRIDKQYELWLPLNKRLHCIISLILKGVNDLNDGIYEYDDLPILYNRATGEYYDINCIIQDTNIRNGTELILM